VTPTEVYNFRKDVLEELCALWGLSTGTVDAMRKRAVQHIRLESKVGRDSAEFKVLADLLKDVPRLISEEHREVLRFFLEVKPVYDLQLVEDKVF
jgi:DNA-directed RNA polymerase sigma subunit (sigma70/sigma32)